MTLQTAALGLLSTLSIRGVLSVLVLYALTRGIYNRYFHPLSRFPGPFWASITSLWYFQTVRLSKAKNVQYALHDKYGDFVRIGPNLLAVCHPDAISTVFGTNAKNGKAWRKGEFYESFAPHIAGARIDGFSERDDAKNAERRRIIAGLYTQGNLLRYEPRVDRIIENFRARMDILADSRETTEMSLWMERYAFDVIGEIYHGREDGFGMVRDGRDYNDWCHLMSVMPDIGASLMYIPWFLKIPYFAGMMMFRSGRDGIRGMLDVTKQAKIAANTRWEAMQKGEEHPTEDILTGLLNIVREKGEEVNWTVADVATEVWAVIWAGSDTTATALSSIFYHLYKHPEKLAKLRSEIDLALADGRLTQPIRYSDARKLPYLHAVVLESMRLHPSLGYGLPREVPAEGAVLCGTPIPGSVEVIMNSGAVQVDARAFGEDAKSWTPERWLDRDASAVKKMDRAMLQFGMGARVCIGRHISEIEMYKLLPTILTEFDFELLVDDWEVCGGWFHRTTNVMCKVERRRKT
ncbi:cytochrome P450 oxidoreductase [Apiospora arundinis]|uniref:Cytochrome P450 oxidoreductase n=1 Tax=Apiospora arundinis TaxID=335852 RepID=A0ABR2IIE5_9PEZI